MDVKNVFRPKNKLNPISVFVDKDNEKNEEKAFIIEFGEKSPTKFKIKNEKPINGDNIKSDINNRPDEPDEREYNITPVSSFGVALLKGMGWQEGQPIGLNQKGLAQPIEFISRPQGLGLGAESKMEYIEHKSNTKRNKITTGPIYMSDGKARHFKGIHERAPEPTGPKVEIKRGKYARKLATLLTVDKRLMTGKLRLDKTDEVVIMSQKDYTVLNTNKKCLGSSWIMTNLKVRIIDKNINEGRHYNKKAKIVHVCKNKCDIIIDEEDLLLREVVDTCLETIVPKDIGATVMVVRGDLKGSIGSIRSRDSKNYLATVSIHNQSHLLPYDYICQLLEK